MIAIEQERAEIFEDLAEYVLTYLSVCDESIAETASQITKFSLTGKSPDHEGLWRLADALVARVVQAPSDCYRRLMFERCRFLMNLSGIPVGAEFRSGLNLEVDFSDLERHHLSIKSMRCSCKKMYMIAMCHSHRVPICYLDMVATNLLMTACCKTGPVIGLTIRRIGKADSPVEKSKLAKSMLSDARNCGYEVIGPVLVIADT